MGILIKISRNLVIASGVLLITGVMFQFEKKVADWSIFRSVLMVICGIGYVSFLAYEHRIGNKEKFLEILISGALIVIIGLLFFFPW